MKNHKRAGVIGNKRAGIIGNKRAGAQIKTSK